MINSGFFYDYLARQASMDLFEPSYKQLLKNYEMINSIVKNNNMAYDHSENSTSHIQINDDLQRLVEEVRLQAKTKSIRFGSTSSAIYHLAIHTDDLNHEYVADANKLIDTGEVIVKKDTEFVNMRFFDKNSGKKCEVVITANGRIILCTYF
jgi:hypothetical protein